MSSVIFVPGPRAGWAGASSSTRSLGIGTLDGQLRGARQQRPDKVAGLVLTVAELDEPPLRPLVGSDAFEYGRGVGDDESRSTRNGKL